MPPGTDFRQGAKFGQLGSYARGNVDVALSEGAAAGARGSGGLVLGADDGGVLFEGVAGCAVTGSGGDDWKLEMEGKREGYFRDRGQGRRWCRGPWRLVRRER